MATASRVASGGAPVRRETRERVEQAMRELRYVPPWRSTADGLVGIVVPDLTNPIFPALAQAIAARAAPTGLASVICTTTSAPFLEVDYAHMLLDRGVRGLIFVACEMTNARGSHRHYARLVEEGTPLVFVNGALPTLDVPSVSVDEHAAAELATQHLLDLGHERIGFVAGPEQYSSTQLKAAGRTTALRAAGLDSEGLVAHAAFGVEGGRRALSTLLALPDPPTAVICSSDEMAIGAVNEAARRGVRVPGELSIVGFDGIEATTWTTPPLTTVEQPVQQIAETSVETLAALLLGPGRTRPNSYFRPLLRARGSTAPPA